MESKINVSVRMKPLSEAESCNEKNHVWQKVGENTVLNQRTKEMFTFDSVFSDSVSTDQVFEQFAKDHVETAMQGISFLTLQAST